MGALCNLAFAEDTVEIEVTGSIKTYCANSSSTLPINAGDVSKAGTATVAFAVDCNAPFQYSMQSENGAMRLADAPAGAVRAASEIPYDVRVKIPLTRGGEINDICKSASLRAGAVTCKFTDSGGRIALDQRAEAQVIWAAPERHLPPGRYEDRLTVFVNSRP